MQNSVELDERDISTLSEEEKYRLACEFSEGSQDLQAFLLYLWNRGINTFACCAGHTEPETVVQENGEVVVKISSLGNPYLYIDISKINSVDLKNILSLLCTSEKISSMETSIDRQDEDDENSKRRYGLDIHLKSMPYAIGEIFDVFFAVMEQGYTADGFTLEPKDKEFVESSVALNSVNVDKIDISRFKKSYKHLPSKLSKIAISRQESGNVKYEVVPDDKRVLCFGKGGLTFICRSAYYRDCDDLLVMTNAMREYFAISEEEAKKRGFISVDEYNAIIHDLFERDQNAFLTFLNSKSEEEMQKQ